MLKFNYSKLFLNLVSALQTDKAEYVKEDMCMSSQSNKF